MRRVSIFGVTPGMRLAYDIKGPAGELLLRNGMALDHTHLRQLKQRNCLFVDVLDGVTDDIEMGETISDRVHVKTTQALQNMHAVLKNAADASVDTRKEEFARRDLQSRGFARNTRETKPVYALAEAAAVMVDEVLDSNATLGLNQIRFFDDYTFQHSVSTAIAGAILGRELGGDKETLTHLSTGCLMHDIGKIFVDREIINKPGKLTPDEIEIVKQHAQIGYEASLQIFGPGVLSNHIPFQHHERQDGTGYPRGLKGSNQEVNPRMKNNPDHILPIAQVASIADVYDALNSDRPYRPTVPPDMLAELLFDLSGAHLNAALLERFLAVLELYPPGSEVLLHGPAGVEGLTGVVVRGGKTERSRPLVRVLYDPVGATLQPFEINLEENPEILVESTLIFAKGSLEAVPREEGARMLDMAHSAALVELESPLLCA